MKKILKIITSRYFISAFVIVLEFSLLLIIFMLLCEHFPIMKIMAYIFYFGVFLYIINKYKTPEFKLTWSIILSLFSFVGAYIFILLVGSEDTKRVSRKHQANEDKLRKELNVKNCLEDLKEDIEAYSQAKYICNVMKMPCYKNQQVTYYDIGESFYDALIEELAKAEEYIFMEYFIIEEGLMWNPIHDILMRKAKEGVKVYVMYDDFGCMTTLNENYHKKLKKEGINTIISNRFRAALSGLHNNRDHRKITVIDGKVAFTGGINIADEYINKKNKYGHWKDNAVKIEGQAVQNLMMLFIEIWNTQSKEQLSLYQFNSINYNDKNENGFIIPYGDGPEEFYPDSIGKNIYLNMIHAAKKNIYITTPYLICDHELLNSLCIAAKRGVDVRIIVPHIPDKKTVFLMTQSNYEVLVKNGVKIYEYIPGFIHAKTFICDEKYATCGTINLDYRSLVHHFECGVWMYNTKCIDKMLEDFMDTLKVSKEVTIKRAKLKGIKKLVAEVLKVFSPLL